MKRIFYVVLSVLLFASFLLTACGTPATEVPSEPVAPEATEAPAPTEVPAPTFSGTATITFVQEPDNLNPMYTSPCPFQVTCARSISNPRGTSMKTGILSRCW